MVIMILAGRVILRSFGNGEVVDPRSAEDRP